MPPKNESKIITLDYVLVLVFFVVEIFSVVVWSILNKGLPHWDMGRHFYSVLIYKTLWLEFFKGEKTIFNVIGFYNYYPPIVHNLALPFYFIFGKSKDAILISNFIWILVLIYSIYFLGLELFGRKSALVSTVFLLASLMLIGQFREFQVDMPLLSIFSLSLYLLIKTNFFRRRNFVIFLGLVLSIGMLVKWTFAAYAAPAVIIYFLYSLTKYKTERKQISLNFLLALLIGFLVCGYWYLRNLASIREDFAANGVNVAKSEGDPTGINLASLTWYSKILLANYLLLPLLTVLLFGLSVGIIRKDLRRNSLFLLGLFIIYYLVFSILPNKDTRYIMPAFAVLALIAGIGVLALKQYWTVILAITLAAFIINNLFISFGRYLPWQKNVGFSSSGYFSLTSDNGYTSSSPQAESCDIEKIISTVPAGKSVRLVGENRLDFSGWALAFYLRNSARVWPGEGSDFQNSDYLVLRSSGTADGFISENSLTRYNVLEEKFSCTDASNVYILKANNF